MRLPVVCPKVPCQTTDNSHNYPDKPPDNQRRARQFVSEDVLAMAFEQCYHGVTQRAWGVVERAMARGGGNRPAAEQAIVWQDASPVSHGQDLR